MNFFKLIFSLILFSGCAHPASHRGSSGEARIPASNESSDASARPPVVSSREIWAYSWTANPLALTDPQKTVGATLEFAQTCIEKLRSAPAETEVSKCEGNGMAAGPGLYTVDNPFTSHDYGTTLLIVKLVPNRKSIGMATGRFTPPPSSGGLDRSWVADARYEGFIYDFRANDLSGRALVIRSSDLVRTRDIQGLDLRPKIWGKFKAHASAVCSEATTVPEILAKWSDQLEFMAIVFNGYNDPSQQNFSKNGKPNVYAIAAAIASDVVASDDLALAEQAKILRSQFPEVRESLDLCNETDTMSLRACLSSRVYSSLIGDEGTPRQPTFAWSFETMKRVVADLHLLTASELEALSSREQLLKAVAQAYTKDATRAARISEAFSCVGIAKKRIRTNQFELWGPDPE